MPAMRCTHSPLYRPVVRQPAAALRLPGRKRAATCPSLLKGADCLLSSAMLDSPRKQTLQLPRDARVSCRDAECESLVFKKTNRLMTSTHSRETKAPGSPSPTPYRYHGTVDTKTNTKYNSGEFAERILHVQRCFSREREGWGLFQRLSRDIGALLRRTARTEHITIQGCGGVPALRLIAKSDVLHFRSVRLRSDARTDAQSGEERVARAERVA